jgi:transcriptional regulator with XRE-family HTH domain
MTGAGVASVTESMNSAIARRLTAIRKARGLSLDALAVRSGISKGMLVYLEQGRANPTIATLCKLAGSLHLSLAELLSASAPGRVIGVVPSEDARVLWRGRKGGTAALLVSSDGPDMLELWEWRMFPGERYQSRPHGAGTIELLAVTQGSLALEVGGAVHVVRARSAASAQTDRSHSYACAGKAPTTFTMAVAERSST